jgi:enamine deaminase RidA (YjgF/YER057c/UK114 family)
MRKVLQPPGWKRPRGYANGIAATGRLVFTAGVIGWDEQERFLAADFVGQFRQVLLNTIAILAEADAAPEHIARMTWYITDRHEYLGNAAEVGAIYRDLIGKTYPAMAVVEVSALMEPEAKIEIETIAVVPQP